MRILLDENVPFDLADELDGHVVNTVAGAGWAGIANGKLLRLASDRYDAFVTMDRHIERQQDLSRFRIRIVVLCASSNRMSALRPLLPLVQKVLQEISPGELRNISA